MSPLARFLLAGLVSDPGPGPIFTDHPDSVTVVAPAVASFRAAATGTGAVSYAWERDTGDGVWADVPAATTTALEIVTAAADNGDRVRVRATDSAGTRWSRVAVLTVATSGSGQPPAPAGLPAVSGIAQVGEWLHLTYAFTGDPPIGYYRRWQRRAASGPVLPPAVAKLRLALAQAGTSPVRVAFAGSSTTAGTGASTTATRYASRVVADLQAAYPSGVAETAVVYSTTGAWTPNTAKGVHGYSAGIGGVKASTYLDGGRLAGIAALNPAVVFHAIGANDYGSQDPPATFRTDLLAAVDAIDQATTADVVHVLVHQHERQDTFASTYQWSAYLAELHTIAAARPSHLVVVDADAEFQARDIRGADPEDLLGVDDVHLTDAGHAVLAAEVGDVVLQAGAVVAPTWVDIGPGADADDYLQTTDDEGADLRAQVDAANAFGPATATSNVVGPVAPAGVLVATRDAERAAVGSTVSHPLAASANMVLIAVHNEAGVTGLAAQAVTYGGVSALPVPGAVAEVGQNRLEVWYLLDAQLPAAGTHDAVVTWAGGTPGEAGIAVHSYIGAPQVIPEVAYAAAGSSASSVVADATTEHDRSLVFGAIGTGNLNDLNVAADGAQVRRLHAKGTTSILATGDIVDAGTAGPELVRWANPAGWNRAPAVTVVVGAPAGAGGGGPGQGIPRDIYAVPGHHELTPHNVPVAVAATTVPAGFGPAPTTAEGPDVGQEGVIVLRYDPAAASRSVYINAQWQTALRESLTRPDGTAATLWGSERLPALVVPASSDRNVAAVIDANGYVTSFQPWTDSDGIGNAYASKQDPPTSDVAARDIYGPLLVGPRNDSGLGALPGVLRRSELETAGAPILHALAVTVDSTAYLAQTGGGFRWPARSASSNYLNAASNAYHGGGVSALVLGSRVVVPWDHDKATLGPLPDLVSRMYDALKTRGAYVSDNRGRAGYSVIVEYGSRAFTYDERVALSTIFQLLHVVTNDAQATPGGDVIGGARRAPMLQALTRPGSPPPPPPDPDPPPPSGTHFAAGDVWAQTFGPPYRDFYDNQGAPFGAHSERPRKLNTTFDWYYGARGGTPLVTGGEWGAFPWGEFLFADSATDFNVWGHTRRARLYFRIGGRWVQQRTESSKMTGDYRATVPTYEGRGPGFFPDLGVNGTKVDLAPLNTGDITLQHFWWNVFGTDTQRTPIPLGVTGVFFAAQVRILRADGTNAPPGAKVMCNVGVDRYPKMNNQLPPFSKPRILYVGTGPWSVDHWFTAFNVTRELAGFNPDLAKAEPWPTAWMTANP